MRKAKKTKAPQRRTALDRIAAQVRTALRRETKNIIEIGKLLIESREHLEHGEWQPWLTENFDLSLRTAQNYCAAAEYVARAKSKSATVADFANLAPSVLYLLAAGHHDEREEAAILAAAKAGKRVDEDAMWDICEALAPADDADVDDDADQEDGGEDGGQDDDAQEDAEIGAILDGPPPAVPPPAPIPSPPNYALQAFDQAIAALKQLMTKSSAQFARTIHSADDLRGVEGFIRAVMQAKAVDEILATSPTQPRAMREADVGAPEENHAAR